MFLGNGVSREIASEKYWPLVKDKISEPTLDSPICWEWKLHNRLEVKEQPKCWEDNCQKWTWKAHKRTIWGLLTVSLYDPSTLNRYDHQKGANYQELYEQLKKRNHSCFNRITLGFFSCLLIEYLILKLNRYLHANLKINTKHMLDNIEFASIFVHVTSSKTYYFSCMFLNPN